ncbi:type II secretion system F family protein [bacterium]|nr:type II secretion system F family protein [candidate division CSSED10-310 bacterium]
MDFAYTAIDMQGRTVKGVMAADSERQLHGKLRDLGYMLLDLDPVRASFSLTFERINRKDLISFTVSLSTVLSAGIPLLTGLRDIEAQTDKAGFRRIIQDVARNVAAGAGLSEALSKHPRVFSPLYVNMVAAGERTGNIEEVLNDLIASLSWQDDLAAEVKQALIYPAVLFSAGCLLVFFLLSFVLPRFLVVFQKAKVELPLPTRILLAISYLFSHYWYVVLLAIAALFIGYRLILRNDAGRLFVDRFILRIPIFGALIRKVALSRFAHYLAALLRAGVDIIEALWVAERVIGNAVLARVIRLSLIRVKEGESLSGCLAQSGEFPSLITRMIGIGERTGALEMALVKVSQHYDKEVPYTIKKIFAIFEPLIIVFLGFLVVGIALSMFLPLYQMIRLMSRG